MRTIPSTTTTSSSLAPRATAPLTGAPRSTWHSPIPYLFGGLAAMLGLIAFALLILACSYWKLSGQLQSEENRERDLENAENDETKNKETVKVYEEKILVIMAGDEKPTFLATPVCPKSSSSFVDGVGYNSDTNLQSHVSCEKLEKEIENNVQSTTPSSQASEENQQQTQRQ